MVSCQKGPTRHAYAWQIGPFWQDTLEPRRHIWMWSQTKQHAHNLLIIPRRLQSHSPRPAEKWRWNINCIQTPTLIARFMGPTWGPSGADMNQVDPMLAPWTMLSGYSTQPRACPRWSHKTKSGTVPALARAKGLTFAQPTGPGRSVKDLVEFHLSLGPIFSKHKTPHVMLAGDVFCSGGKWNSKPLDSNIRDTCPGIMKDKFVTITSPFGCIQHQTTFTRPESTLCLDLVYTNHQ